MKILNTLKKRGHIKFNTVFLVNYYFRGKILFLEVKIKKYFLVFEIKLRWNDSKKYDFTLPFFTVYEKLNIYYYLFIQYSGFVRNFYFIYCFNMQLTTYFSNYKNYYFTDSINLKQNLKYY